MWYKSQTWFSDWRTTTACRLLCWDASGQVNNRVGTQPHPLSDRPPKAFLSQQLPVNTSLDTILPTKRTRPYSLTSGQESPSHQEVCTSPLTNRTHQETGTRTKKYYDPAAWIIETTNKVRRKNKVRLQTKLDGKEICSRWRKKNPRTVTKRNGSSQSTWKIIHNNHSKDNPPSWKNNGGPDQEDTRNV